MQCQHSPQIIARIPASAQQRHTQSGTVLVISLVLLAVVTTLVVSSISDVMTTEKLMANAEIKDATFQAASSAAQGYVYEMTENEDFSLIQESLDSINAGGDGFSSTRTITLENEGFSGEVRVGFVGTVTNFVSNSLNADATSSTLNIARFEIVGEGFVADDPSKKSVIRQGIDFQ